MKKLLIICAILFAGVTRAQTVDTVKFAVQVQPKVTDEFVKDTAFQMRVERVWVTPHDTTVQGGSYVVLYDRKAKPVKSYNIDIPYSVLKVWLDDSVIDDYILTYLGLYRRY